MKASRAAFLAIVLAAACGDDDAEIVPPPTGIDAGAPISDASTPPPIDATPDAPPPGPCAANTNYQTDFANCGRCGHTCMGGACTAGVCQPIVLTSSSSQALELLVAGPNLYYTNAAGDVIAFPIGDETSRILATGQTNVRRIATDGTSLYWTKPADGSVWRCELLGCGQNPQMIASGQASPFDVAWDPARHRVVWTNHVVDDCADAGPGDIRSALADGGDPQILVPDAGYASNVAATPSALYWSADRCREDLPTPPTISKLLANGDRQAFATVDSGLLVEDLAVDDAGVVFSVRDDDSYTVSATGSIAQLATANPQRVALDDTYVYWTSEGASNTHELRWRKRSAGAGAAEASISFTGDSTGAIATSAKSIYFVRGHSIMALAKP